MIDITMKICPIYSAINLEDIKAPECFDTERPLIEMCDFPMFHDDQHGTAIVVGAGLLNSLRLTNKKIDEVKVVINGSGAAGISVTELLYGLGMRHITLCDTKGAIYKGRKFNMNKYKDHIAEFTNIEKKEGLLVDIIKGTDIFVGLSAPGVVTKEMIRTMNTKAVVFAMANPIPEIYPNEAVEGGAYVTATGRSDFANQVNNCLAFPGLFRGLLDIKAKKVTMEMKVAASKALASIVKDNQLQPEYIIPDALDPRVGTVIAEAVAKTGLAQNLCQRKTTADYVADDMRNYFLVEELKNVTLK